MASDWLETHWSPILRTVGIESAQAPVVYGLDRLASTPLPHGCVGDAYCLGNYAPQ